LTSLETYLPRKIVFNEKMESKFQMHSANIWMQWMKQIRSQLAHTSSEK
jgi:hypothetical protein